MPAQKTVRPGMLTKVGLLGATAVVGLLLWRIMVLLLRIWLHAHHRRTLEAQKYSLSQLIHMRNT
jgi:type IV secretory pathway TrbD component